MRLREHHELRLPDYQRPYRWDESLVTAFAKDFFEEESAPIDLGFLMLQPASTATSEGSAATESWDARPLLVVDGQQRLVTFALLLCAELGKDSIPAGSRLQTLLDCAAQNAESEYRIAETKRTLEHLLDAEHRERLHSCLKRAQAALLYRPSNNMEELKRLFDDANTTGLPLTGWQILKARHYGYILRENASQSSPHGDPDALLEALEAWRRGGSFPHDVGKPKTYQAPFA